jgi:selenide,water dikinase
VLPVARSLAAEGLVPGGSRRNLAYVEPHVAWQGAVPETDRLLLCDAQTSGGLLIAVPPEAEAALLAELERRGAPARAVVGEIVSGEPGTIHVVA